MNRLMGLDHDLQVRPGHTDPTTIGDEWETNPFIRVWRGLDPEGDEPCTVFGDQEATARPARPGLRRRPQGVGPLARRPGRHRARLPGQAQPRSIRAPWRARRTPSRPPASGGSRPSGGSAAGQAAKQVGTRAANVARSDEKSTAALERRQIEAAEQIVAVLGTMKGAAMKIGQVLSFLDVGLVPEEYREEFQAKLAELRDAAPKVSFKDMKKVLESEYGDKLDEVFESFDPVPIAAASIGQVYKATLDDGRHVAVKVQYPGVAAAVRADMQNLGVIMRLLKSRLPGPRRQGDGRRDPRAHPRGARLRARGVQPEDARAHLPRPPVHLHPRRHHVAVAREGRRDASSSTAAGSRSSSSSRRRSATGSARSSTASTTARCTATGSSPATRTRATRC